MHSARSHSLSSLVVGWVLALTVAVPARGSNMPQKDAPKRELLVSAAVSLKPVLQDIARLFEAENTGTKVFFNLGASGQLQQQISRGANVDVFISASPKQIRNLAQQNLIEKTSETVLARNQLMIISPRNGAAVKNISDLLKCRTIAVGNPKTVPAGEYALKFLRGERALALLERENRLIYGESVRQVLSYVEGGNVDAGFVYITDAERGNGQQKIQQGLRIPVQKTGEIAYTIAAVKTAAHKGLAAKFIAFCQSEKAKSALKQRGFLVE